MELKINSVSFLLVLVFTFQSKLTDGQVSENRTTSTLVTEINPLLNAELVREPRQTIVSSVVKRRSEKNDKPVHEKISPKNENDDDEDETLEKGDPDDADGSYSSSSSSEESGPKNSKNIRTSSKPAINISSTDSGKKPKLMRADTAKLVKSPDANKTENVKRSANLKASASISIGGSASSSRGSGNTGSSKSQGNILNSRNGERGEGSDRVTSASASANIRGDGAGGKSGRRGVSFRGIEVPPKNKSRRGSSEETLDVSETNESIEKDIGRGISFEGIFGRGIVREKPGGKEHKAGGGYGGTGGRGGIRENDGVRGGGGTRPKQIKQRLKQQLKNPNIIAHDPANNNNRTIDGWPTDEKLINRTSRHPFSVERASRPIDPDVYSFFQYKPAESIGYLWTQNVELKKGGFGGMFGRGFGGDLDEDEDDEAEDPTMQFGWEFKRYDRACLYVEYNINKQRFNASQVSEEVNRMVDTQNEKLARKFLDWQFINKEDHETIALKGEGENHPQYLTYKFLTMTMEIFRDKICRNATPYANTPEVKNFAPARDALKAEANKKYLDTKLLPKAFIDDLYRLFLTLRDITLPKGVPDYASKRDEEDIYSDVLENCLKQDPIQWYSHSCADQVLSYDDPHNYACTPLVEYDFNHLEYDPILDGMWHMFTAVHGFCFGLFNKRSTRLLHKYSMIIANSFTVGMRARWKASIADTKFYVRLLGPDFNTHLETMNRCMFGATLRSGAPSLLPRFLTVAPITFERERIIGKDASESHPKS